MEQYTPTTYDYPQVQQSQPLKVEEDKVEKKEKKNNGIIGMLANMIGGGGD